MTRIFKGIDLAVARFSNPEGRLERFFPINELQIPSDIRLEGYDLVWEPDKPAARRVEAGKGVLEQFAKLADAEPKSYLAFAKRWGPLGLCKHNVPASHNQIPSLTFTEGQPEYCSPLGYESLDCWRAHAWYVASILKVSSKLHAGNLATEEDWYGVLRGNEDEEIHRASQPIYKNHDMQRYALEACINQMIDLANVTPKLVWDCNLPKIIFASGEWGGLFGAITMQLMLAISQKGDFATCSGCGMSYLPFRKPKYGQRNYCEACRKSNIPIRDAARDYRRRMK
jgi:hypothetical protein